MFTHDTVAPSHTGLEWGSAKMHDGEVVFADRVAIMTFADGDPAEVPWVDGAPRADDIAFEDHNPSWALDFKLARHAIAGALPETALRIAHIGSTAVPGLMAKPVIDIDLIVADPDREEEYVPALAEIGFVLTIRERSWYQHRMLRGEMPRINLHVFGPDCPEHLRHLLFRDWLCSHADDRARYAIAKQAARDGVETVAHYNQRKRATILEIYDRIFADRGWVSPA